MTFLSLVYSRQRTGGGARTVIAFASHLYVALSEADSTPPNQRNISKRCYSGSSMLVVPEPYYWPQHDVNAPAVLLQAVFFFTGESRRNRKFFTRRPVDLSTFMGSSS
jgi:hypothetical protein